MEDQFLLTDDELDNIVASELETGETTELDLAELATQAEDIYEDIKRHNKKQT